MRPTENIKSLLKKLNFDADGQVHGRILDDALAAQEKAKSINPAGSSAGVWGMIMKSRITKFAVAAVAIIAVLIGVHYYGGEVDGTSVVWADVIKRIDQVKDYSYRQWSVESSGVIPTGFEFKNESETRWYFSSEFGTRWDQYYDGKLSGQYYTMLKKQQSVWINTFTKTYRCRAENMPCTMSLDPRRKIRAIIAGPHVTLGRKMINGVMAEGIEVQGQKAGSTRLDNAVSQVWVDVETNLPISLQSEGKIHNRDKYGRAVEDEFQWNLNLMESDFTPDIGADYIQEDWPEDDRVKWEKIIDTYTKKDIEVDFGPLEKLGLLGGEKEPEQPAKALTGIEEIHKAQDQMISSWPRYGDLRESLQNELDEKVNLKSSSVEELVRIGVLLREKFWDAGGCFSTVSYRYGYMARVLLELAYARQPDDLAVGDELAESIMSIGTMHASKTEKFSELLLSIRRSQFRQICEEVKGGRKPVWEDFARGCDVVYLSSVKEPNEAVAVVDWLIQNADAGGWDGCMDTLNWMRPLAAKGSSLGFYIYCAIKPGFPEEFRYGGRPPSFKGPRSRILVPTPVVKEK